MKDLFSYYIAMLRFSVLIEFQYPLSAAFYMIGMVAEPVSYTHLTLPTNYSV